VEENQPVQHTERMRKTVSFTHRQLGIGGGLLAAIVSIGQLRELKEFFVGDTDATIARIETQQKEGFARLEKIIKDSNEDFVDRLRRSRDIAIAENTAVEMRCDKRSDRIETRISNLEIFTYRNKKSL
jgi:hypothetical protein